MRAFGARVLAPFVVAAFVLAGVGVQPAGAAADVGPKKIAGTYTLYYTYVGPPYANIAMTLLRNHTGSDADGETIVWSTVGRDIELDFSAPGVTATYLGTVTKKGLSTIKHPGTLSNSFGSTGIWYAVKSA